MREPLLLSKLDFGRFGIRSGLEAETFLKSPAGQGVLKEVAVRYNIDQSLMEQREFEWAEEARLERRIMAFILFSILAWRAAKAQRIQEMNEATQAMIDEKLQRLQAENNATTTDPHAQALRDVQAFLQKTSKEMESQIGQLDEAHKGLISEQEKLTLDISQLRQEIATWETDLAEILQLEANEQALAAAITRHEQQLNVQQTALVEQISSQDQAMQTPIQAQIRLTAKLQMLLEVQRVRKGELNYYNAAGERVDSCAQAHFVCRPSQQIVRDPQAGFLILSAGVNRQQLQVSEVQQAAALFKEQEEQFLSKPYRFLLQPKENLKAKEERLAEIPKLIQANREKTQVLHNGLRVIQALQHQLSQLQQPAPRNDAAVEEKQSRPSVDFRAQLRAFRQQYPLEAQPVKSGSVRPAC